MVRKPTKLLYNPFPREPSNIGFLKGTLMYDHSALHTKAFAAGEGFVIKWHSIELGGYLSVHHAEEPDRTLWSSLRGHAFVSGALGNDVVQESRGSFSIHDKADLLLTHQTIEQINVVLPEERKTNEERDVLDADPIRRNANIFFHESLSISDDGDGHKACVRGPAVLVTGCIYNEPELAACQLKQYKISQSTHTGPFYDINRSKATHIGVRYWLFFYEKRDHHLGFSIKLEQPVQQEPDLPSLALFHHQPRYSEILQTLSKQRPDSGKAYRQLDALLWLWSSKPLSAFEQRDQLQYTSDKINKPLASLKRLRVNDMFELKSPARVACEEQLHKDSLALMNFTNGPEKRGLDNRANNKGKVLDCKLNRVILTYAAEEDEQFFGFGEQFSFFNLKGKRVPIMVQEQGLGRGDQPITVAVNLVAERSGGDWHTTYAPVPYYITSKSRCVFLEEYNYSVFDLSRKNQVQIQLHGEKMEGRILHGRTPLQLIERYTEAIGRMRALPDWIVEGAVVGMQGGTQAVRDAWSKLKQADVPISAFWLQDWVGQRKTSIGWQLWWNWELDEEHYSQWSELVKDLQDQGINILAYVNPFLAKVDNKPKATRDLFKEAKRLGYLVKTSTGSPYMIPNTSFDAAMLDLTNPEAWMWLKGVMQSMIQTGIKGWMADFGESLPFDGKLYTSEDPQGLHNKYPEMWAQLNREVVEECGDKDMVFFMRSAYTKSPRWATLFWEGDQMVSWQRNDGIKSAVVGLLSSGISGFAFNHSDVGGYCTVDLPFLRYHRSEELLLRWMELNAFSTIFRTHEGNIPNVNHQFDTNATTLQHFARFAKVYRAWAFYRKLLVMEATTMGLPVVRHMFLHYAHDPQTTSICFEQFLVGKEILVVPVLDKGHSHVWAYFPYSPDEWQHVWTGKIYTPFNSNKGLKVRIHAPLGYPAIFVRKNSPIGQRFRENLTVLDLLPDNGIF
ncbi:hypothetical protein GOP47_0013535 [Adiantum capillus-veneris]|uniref:Alpha-glucosidase n=1 Tax=Adiantum capillus-veneris TaxID=13818 RepID=A0A9D4UNQ1_ADICA|nr:hypothetical protein GOP47_0013535 [Adiantum capillus-veneris]